MEWYLKVLRQYADFNGRARAKEYWMFVVFNILVSIVFSVIDGVVLNLMLGIEIPILGSLYSLAVIVPSIAVGVRRLHDRGKSGWMLLIGLIPFIGSIWLIVLFAGSGEAFENQYGPNPKLEGAAKDESGEILY